MRWLVRYINQFRRPQVVVANVGQAVIVNGRPYMVHPNGLRPLPYFKKG